MTTDRLTDTQRHISGIVSLALGMNSDLARSLPENRRLVQAAEIVAAKLAPHLLVFGEMVEAAECEGWDGDDTARAILDRARDAHAALTGFDNTKAEHAS